MVRTLLFQTFLLFFMATGLFAQTAIQPQGAGTSTDPYLIETWENLYWVSQNSSSWNSYFVQTADIEFPSDINTWDNGAGWTPIGDGTTSIQGNQTTVTGQNFLGDYNGQYYTITGLYINRPGTDNQGLFGHIGDPDTEEGISTRIYNVRLRNSEVYGARAVGSLVGRVTGNQNTLVERSSSEGGSVTGNAVTGGLVGGNNGDRAAPGLEDDTNPVISQSWTDIAVNYSGVQDNPSEKFGGIAGCNQKGTILDSYARGPVTVDNTGNSWTVERVGGLAGCLEERGRVERSFSTGLVTVAGDVILYGGLVGNLGGTGQGNIGVVVDSYWDTQTSGQSTSAGGAGVEGKTTNEMTYPYDFNDVYVTWDFTTIWEQDVDETMNNGYPYLLWQEIEPTAPYELAFSQQPTNTIAGEDITPAVSVEALDINGNRAESFTGNVSISIQNDPTGGANLLGTLTVAAVDGLATFSGLSIQEAGEGYTLSAVDDAGDFDPVVSDPFNILPGPADAGQSTVEANPETGVVADGTDNSTITVTLYDQYGNLLTTGGDDVFLETNLGSLGAIADNGDGTYQANLTSTEAGTATVTAYLGTNNLGDLIGSVNVEFIPGPADAGESIVEADPETGLVADNTDNSDITVTLYDQYGNILTTGGDDVFLTTNLGNLSAITDNGDGTYQASLTSTEAGTATVTAYLGTDDQGDLIGSVNVEFIAGAATQLIIDGFALSQVRNVPFNVTVTLADQFGNPVENNGTNTIVLNSEKNSTGGEAGDLRFASDLTNAPELILANGESSVVFEDVIYTGLSDPNELPDIRITGEATGTGDAGGLTGDSDLFAVRESQLEIVANPASIEANGTSTSSITVTFLDYTDPNNPAPIEGTAITLSTTKGTLDGGVTELTLVTDANGVVSATLTSSTDTGVAVLSAVCPGACEVSTDVAFTAGPADAGQSTVEANPETGVVADGTDYSTITVALYDQYGNPLTTGGDDVFLETNLGSLDVITDNGDGTYQTSLTSTEAGTATVTAYLGTNNQGDLIGSVNVAFIPGDADAGESIVEANPATGIVADGTDNSAITVTLYDQYGNLLTTGGDNVFLETNLGSLGAITDNGDGTYQASLTSTEAGTATVTAFLGTDNQGDLIGSVNVEFVPGPADAGESTVEANPETGVVADNTDNSTITVTLFDQYGNVLTTGGDDVFLETDLGSLGATTDNGDGTYQASLTSSEAGTATVTAYLGTDNLGDLIGSVNVEFIAGAPAQLAFTEQPQDATAGAQIGNPYVVVEIQDAFGNLVTNATNSIILQLGDPGNATLYGTTGMAASGGVATFTDLWVDKIGVYTLTASGAQQQTTSDEFEITAGPVSASNSSVTAQSPRIADGNDISLIAITLNDAYNNPITAVPENDFNVAVTGNAVYNGFTEDGNGEYSYQMTNTTAETVSVTVTADGTELDEKPEVEFTCSTLSGVVEYYKYYNENNQPTAVDEDNIPMAGVTVRLIGANDIVLAETTTSSAGSYQFNDPAILQNALYIEVETELPHGGRSSVNALAVQRRAIEQYVNYWNPTPFMDQVSDVSGSGSPTTADALRILQRFVSPHLEATKFDAGDWAFYSPDDEVIFGNTDKNIARRPYHSGLCEVNILARAYGDLRGIYNPEPMAGKTLGFTDIQGDQISYVETGDVFDLPLYLTHDMQFNAMSLHLQYDADKIEVLDVKSDIPGLLYGIEDGQVRLSFADVHQGQDFNAEEALLQLEVRTISTVHQGDILFTLAENSEFGDAYAQPIADFNLAVNSVVTDAVTEIAEPGDLDIAFTAYPNPFRDVVNFRYNLSERANVRITITNVMGARVAEVVNTTQPAGMHEEVFHPSQQNFRRGLYLIRVEITGENDTHEEVYKMMYTD